jgi:hypothetical protein
MSEDQLLFSTATLMHQGKRKLIVVIQDFLESNQLLFLFLPDHDMNHFIGI